MEDTNPLEDPRHFPGTAIWIVGGLVALMIGVGFYFREAKTRESGGVKVAAVTENPSDYVGRTVTVRGEVENMLGSRAFIMEDKGPGSEMLVVAAAPDAMPRAKALEDSDAVQVVGEVRPFDPGKMPGEVGFAATDERLTAVRGKPVLYAFQVIVPPHGAEDAAGSGTARN